LWQQSLHIRALAVPGHKTMNGEGMPQVVKTWLVARPIVPMDIRKTAETAESVFDKRPFYGLAMACYEKGCDAAAWDTPFIPLLLITHERTREASSNWRQPCAIELAFADRKQTVGQVDILWR
jgi:hypothetical protein